MDTILGIDHVLLTAPAGCEAEARRFFGELLGLEEIEQPELLRARGGVWFRIGAQELHVGVEAEFVPARKAHPSLEVRAESLDDVAARLDAAGAGVKWNDEIPGVRRFYAVDPWGNRIEFRGV
jgi:catechol 2,3-dioxygenase-like lactoylglutathione lyase family enzyme